MSGGLINFQRWGTGAALCRPLRRAHGWSGTPFV